MRLSDIKGERALDVLADIMDPMTEILSDPRVKEIVKNEDKLGLIKHILKEHKISVLNALAVLDGEDPESYNPSLPSIPAKILELVNDPELQPFFYSQGQKKEKTSSGSATESIEAKEA